MKYPGVGVIIWNERAYIPSTVECYSGIVIQVEPVYSVDLNVSEISKYIQKVLSSLDQQARIPDPTRDEWKRRKDPVLAATKAKSWKNLAQAGHGYGIGWLEKAIRLTVNQRDKKGRWEINPEKTRLFPLGTPLEDIVATILDDYMKSKKDEPTG